MRIYPIEFYSTRRYAALVNKVMAMTEINNETKADVCAPEKTPSPERVQAVVNDAYRFNQVLQDHKAWTWGDIDVVEKAGNAFNRELAEIPIAGAKNTC